MRLKAIFFLITISAQLSAGEADILDVAMDCNDENVCTLSVTVAHEDEGWDHYADRWEVLNPSGGEIAARELAHPHVDEQPFIRSLGGVQIPGGVDTIVVRAHDSVHGYGGAELSAKTPE
jgi:hypothetical protein